jgi:hypothetical protein
VLEVREHPPSKQKMSTVGPLGGGAGGPGVPTLNAKNVDGKPTRGRCQMSGKAHHQCNKHQRLTPGRQCQRSESACHQRKKCRRQALWGGGGGDGGSGAPTTQLEDVDGGPLEVVSEVQERPPSTQKTSMADPLGGDAGGSGAPTINGKNIVDGRPAGVRCQRSESAHHQCKKHRRRAPWEVVPEVREILP